MISIFQIIESISTTLRNNDIRLDLQSNVESGDYKSNTKAKESGETLERTSDQVELSGACEPVPEEQPISHQTLSEERVIPGDSKPPVKPKVIEDSERQTSSNEELKETCPDCTECRIQRCDPSRKEMSMCLHAAVYKVWWPQSGRDDYGAPLPLTRCIKKMHSNVSFSRDQIGSTDVHGHYGPYPKRKHRKKLTNRSEMTLYWNPIH